MKLDTARPSPGVVRLRWSADGAAESARSWTPLTAEALAATDACSAGDADTAFAVTHDELRIETREDGDISVHRSSDGSQVVVVSSACPRPDGPGTRCVLRNGPGWSYFGCGERTGMLERTGRRYTCWTTDRFESLAPDTDELYVAVPFLLAIDDAGRCSGLFVDTTWRSTFDLTDVVGGTVEVAVDGPALDVYVLTGATPQRLMEQYTWLTGRMPMPPRWALGFIQSRWSYASAASVRDVVGEFRRRALPLDAIGLDIDYMDRYRPFTWNDQAFPNPRGLVAELRGRGCRVVAINDCALKADPPGRNAARDEAAARGYFVTEPSGAAFTAYVWPGLAMLPDFARSDVRAWWAQRQRFFVDVGIAGVLNDMNEPGLRDRPLDDPSARRVEVPPDVLHGDEAERATHAEVHNVFGTLVARACAEGLRELRPDERALVLSRAGYAGLQRFAGTWTGDSHSSWEHLEMSLPEMINVGLSGIPLVGADIGGFFGHCTGELFARWMQLGALSPLMRANNARGCTDQEPWVWGDEIEAACRNALELRYTLLPYLYTVFAEAHRTGAPVLRPLWWLDTADAAGRTIADEAMLGDGLLVAPVVRPGHRARAVYLPAGRWFDHRTDTEVIGPTTVLASARLDEAPPMFGRGGTIVALGPRMQWSDERSVDPLTLHVHPDADDRAHGELYEDDGTSYRYEEGHCCVTRFDYDGGHLRSRRNGQHAPATRTVVVVVHGRPTRERRAVLDRTGAWEVSW